MKKNFFSRQSELIKLTHPAIPIVLSFLLILAKLFPDSQVLRLHSFEEKKGGGKKKKHQEF